MSGGHRPKGGNGPGTPPTRGSGKDGGGRTTPLTEARIREIIREEIDAHIERNKPFDRSADPERLASAWREAWENESARRRALALEADQNRAPPASPAQD